MIYNPPKKKINHLCIYAWMYRVIQTAMISFHLTASNSTFISMSSDARLAAHMQRKIALQSQCVAHHDPQPYFACTHRPAELSGYIDFSGVKGESGRSSCTQGSLAAGVRSGTSRAVAYDQCSPPAWPVVVTLTYGVPAAPASRPPLPHVAVSSPRLTVSSPHPLDSIYFSPPVTNDASDLISPASR